MSVFIKTVTEIPNTLIYLLADWIQLRKKIICILVHLNQN